MSKITLNPVGSLIDVTTAQTAINNNFNTIQTAMDNTLSRDGTSPNQVEATVDMNSNRLTNLPEPIGGSEPLRLQDVTLLNGGGTINTVPVGGATGAPLIKNSAANYDMAWGTTTGSGDFVRNTSPTLVTPALGTPSSVTLTNATGLPLAGISGLGTNVSNFLSTPSSATLASALTDETGTGSAVFSSSPTIDTPTLTAPVLGTPASGNLSNCTNLNASALSSGTVPAAQMPALTGDCTSSAGTVATTVTKSNGVALNYGAVSTTTSLTVTAGSGTLTAASASLRYQTRGKLTWFQLAVTITTNGTGATNIAVSGLPWTFGSDCVVAGRAYAGSGKMLQGYAVSGTSAITIVNYDNSYPAVTGEILKLTGVVENT